MLLEDRNYWQSLARLCCYYPNTPLQPFTHADTIAYTNKSMAMKLNFDWPLCAIYNHPSSILFGIDATNDILTLRFAIACFARFFDIETALIVLWRTFII